MQQVCRVLIMLLRLSEAKDAPPDFAERVQAVLLPDPGALSSAVFAVRSIHFFDLALVVDSGKVADYRFLCQ